MKISVHSFYEGPNCLYYVTGVNPSTRNIECLSGPGQKPLLIPAREFKQFRHRPDIISWTSSAQPELPAQIRREFGVEVGGELLEALRTHPRRGELLAACEKADVALPKVPGNPGSLPGRLPISGSEWRRWMMWDLGQQIQALRIQQNALEDHQPHILKFND